MIYLNQIYIGNLPVDGKPSSIILRDTTMDICVSSYKGGTATTVSYSAVKYVHANGPALVLKIMRTEVVLTGFNPDDCSDIARIIEIGRREPVEESKVYRTYKAETERKEAKIAKATERKMAKEAKIAAISDGIQRYMETRAINRAKEAEREQMKSDKLRHAEDQILRSLADFNETEEQIASKMSELNVLFNKYFDDSESEDEKLSDKVLRIYRENLVILDEKFPGSETAIRSKSQLERFEERVKEKNKNATINTIFGVAIVIVCCALIFLLEKLGILDK